VKRDITSYVDHYGKEVKGFLTYPEFKEVYQIHVHPSEQVPEGRFGSPTDKLLSPRFDEGKLRALFGIFDH
jgi:hypothetical protein